MCDDNSIAKSVKTSNTQTTEPNLVDHNYKLKDLAHLQLPFKLSDTVDSFLSAIENGTNEVKFLLTKECDLLVECKVCTIDEL